MMTDSCTSIVFFRRGHNDNSSARIFYKVYSLHTDALSLVMIPSSNEALWLLCMKNYVWLTACHLPGVLNTEADQQSRVINERLEWQLRPDIFARILEKLGTPEIDLFASRLNKQLTTYVSWKPNPGAIHVDAFKIYVLG